MEVSSENTNEIFTQFTQNSCEYSSEGIIFDRLQYFPKTLVCQIGQIRVD